MAFSFGAFARGFAQAAVEDKREKEEEIKEIIKTSYTQSLEDAKEFRKERKAKREKLKSIGQQLKMMNMSDSQVAGVLSNGVDGAQKTLDLLQATALEYGKQGRAFEVNDFVSASEESNLTLDDAVNRVMGTVKVPEAGADLPSLAEQSTIFGSLDKFTQSQVSQLEEGFGEDLAKLQAEARGDLEYGELPTATVDIAKMGMPDPVDALNERAKQLDIQIKELELEEAKKGTDGFEPLKSSVATKAQKQILGRLSTAMQIDLKYDDKTGLITSPTATADQIALARKLSDQGMELMQAFGGSEDYVTAYSKTMDILLGGLDTTSSTSANTSTSSTTTTTTASTALPTYNPSQTPASYITSAAQTLNVSAMNPNQKATAKAQIRNALIAGGMSAVDANKEIAKIIK